MKTIEEHQANLKSIQNKADYVTKQLAATQAELNEPQGELTEYRYTTKQKGLRSKIAAFEKQIAAYNIRIAKSQDLIRNMQRKPKNTPIADIFDRNINKRVAYFIKKHVAQTIMAAAPLLNTHQSSLSLVVKGKKPVSVKLIDNLVKQYRANPDYLTKGDKPEQLGVNEKPSLQKTLDTAIRLDDVERKLQIMEYNFNHLYDFMERLLRAAHEYGVEFKEQPPKRKQ